MPQPWQRRFALALFYGALPVIALASWLDDGPLSGLPFALYGAGFLALMASRGGRAASDQVIRQQQQRIDRQLRKRSSPPSARGGS